MRAPDASYTTEDHRPTIAACAVVVGLIVLAIFTLGQGNAAEDTPAPVVATRPHATTGNTARHAPARTTAPRAATTGKHTVPKKPPTARLDPVPTPADWAPLPTPRTDPSGLATDRTRIVDPGCIRAPGTPPCSPVTDGMGRFVTDPGCERAPGAMGCEAADEPRSSWGDPTDPHHGLLCTRKPGAMDCTT